MSNGGHGLQTGGFVLPTAPGSPEAAARSPELPGDGPGGPEVHFYSQQQQKPPQLLANNASGPKVIISHPFCRVFNPGLNLYIYQ